MKRTLHKFLLLFSVLFLFCNYVQAQDLLILKDGKKIRGSVLSVHVGKVRFESYKGDRKTYKRRQIKKLIDDTDGEKLTYEFRDEAKGITNHLSAVLVAGEINLYQVHEYKPTPEYNTTGGFHTILYLHKTGSKRKASKTYGAFKSTQKTLASYFSKCPELKKLIKEDYDSFDSIEDIVKYYNTNCAEEKTNYDEVPAEENTDTILPEEEVVVDTRSEKRRQLVEERKRKKEALQKARAEKKAQLQKQRNARKNAIGKKKKVRDSTIKLPFIATSSENYFITKKGERVNIYPNQPEKGEPELTVSFTAETLYYFNKEGEYSYENQKKIKELFFKGDHYINLPIAMLGATRLHRVVAVSERYMLTSYFSRSYHFYIFDVKTMKMLEKKIQHSYKRKKDYESLKVIKKYFNCRDLTDIILHNIQNNDYKFFYRDTNVIHSKMLKDISNYECY